MRTTAISLISYSRTSSILVEAWSFVGPARGAKLSTPQALEDVAIQGSPLSRDQPITVLCVDDHAIVREGIVFLIEGDLDLKIVCEAEPLNRRSLLSMHANPDVTVIDLRLPDRDGVEVIRELREEFLQARFVVLTSAEGDMT